MSRRSFLRAGVAGAGALTLGPAFLQRAFAAGPVTVGPGPYGPIGAFDANGIALPAGFSSRQIARGSMAVAGGGAPYIWHNFTDGQATFRTVSGGAPDGGWILVANSELPIVGGVSGVEFGPDGAIERAYRVLAGTNLNCAGGPTPWGTWLSCEEFDNGQVHECDPATLNALVARPAMGVFSHEAACVDPVNERIYLTEDKGDGCLYRFTPADYPDLGSGLLEVAVGAAPGNVTWTVVPNPGGGAASPTRNQVAGVSRFKGGEGTWFDDGVVYFTTKGDGRVWTLNVATDKIEVLYDPNAVTAGPLSGVDNITVSQSGDVYVCEDGADHDICMITPGFEVTRFLKLDPVTHAGGGAVQGNETVGVVFSPDGRRMYFGAQRSFGLGAVYEVSGPFRQTAGSGSGQPAAKAPATIRLRARRKRAIPKLLRRGFNIRLDIDEPVGIDATLKVDKRIVARARPSVAVSDLVALRLRPTKNAAKLLDGREEVTAKLRVVATDSAGVKTVFRRKVRLVKGEDEKPGK